MLDVTAEVVAAAVVQALIARGETVAVAESLTGGMVTASLVGVPGASRVLRGAVVAYATDLKHHLLGVDAQLLAAAGPVDPQVAVQMATGVRARLGADWGIATTGVAGPGEQDGHPAGTVHIAVVGPGCAPGEAQVRSLRLSGGREEVRAATVDAVLGLLKSLCLEGRPGTSPAPPELLSS